MSLQDLIFEFADVRGYRSIAGPTLEFTVNLRADTRNLMSRFREQNISDLSAYYMVASGDLYVKSGNMERIVGRCTPLQPYFSVMGVGETSAFSVSLQLSDLSMTELLEIGHNRTFKLLLHLMGAFIGGDLFSIGKTQITGEVFQHNSFWVTGKINRAPSSDSFQVPIESWKDAINATKSGKYLVKELIVNELKKPHVKLLLKPIEETEALLMEGKLDDAISKLRKIPEAFGYKNQNAPERYSKLKNIDLSKHEREPIVYLLDFLWKWSARGHHSSADGKSSTSYEQVKTGLEVAYSIVSIFARYDYIEV